MASVAHIIRRRRERKARQQIQQRRSRIWMLLILAVTGFLIIVPMTIIFGVAGYLYVESIQYMPSRPDTIYRDPRIGSTNLYDRSGQTLLYEVEDPLGNQRRWIEMENLPKYILAGTLLMEDRNFLTVTRWDAVQSLSRMWRYILGTPATQNQTITLHLVENVLLAPARQSGKDDALLRIALVSEVERNYSPEDILEWHLNTNDYGNDAYGIDAAAQVYLGKSAQDLTLDEAALLIAIAPNTRYNPFDDEIAARGRQADLLRDLLNNRLISQNEFDNAVSVVTRLRADFIQKSLIAPDFSVYARLQAQNILNSLNLKGEELVSRGGLEIITTLDLDFYYQSECILRAHIDRLSGGSGAVSAENDFPCNGLNYLAQPFNLDVSFPPTDGTLVMLDVTTGEIYSLVGDAKAVSHAPGTTLHPFVYFEAFLNRLFTPASMVYDIPRAFPGTADGLIYTPINPDGRFRGPINLHDVMTAGLLPPAVSVANSRGMTQAIRTAHRIGLNSLDENITDLSLLERGGSVSVLDMTYAYSVFASLGDMHGVDAKAVTGYRQRDPVAILSIRDSEGRLLWEYKDERKLISKTGIFDASLGYLVNNILSDNSTRNRVLATEDESLLLTRPSAIVSGLTSDKRDAWTIGYTPNIIVGVNLTRDDGQSMSLDAYGRQSTAPVWRAIMNYSHDRNGLPADNWQRPINVEEYLVCNISGLIPDQNNPCPTRHELVPPDSVLLQDTFWQTFEVNSQTGQLATANTPSELRSEEIYFIPPPEIMEWWIENGQPLPPTGYDTISRPEVLKAVQILQPADFAYVGGQVDLRGSIDDPNIQYYQLSYGQDVNPRQWLEIGGQRSDYSSGTSLGVWNTSGLNGVYTLRFTVVFDDGSIDLDTNLVTIDNTPPGIELLAGDFGQTVRYPATTVLPLIANATDNLTIDRVEFYQNGSLLGIDREWPYGFEYDIRSVGTETFSAVVFDQVGNSAQTDLVVDIVRSG